MPLSDIVSCFKAAGSGPVPVQLLHAAYPDCVQDEGGWLLSKTASADVADLQRRRFLTIDESGVLYKASLDWSLVSLMMTATGEKTASESEDPAWAADVTGMLEKFAQEVEAQAAPPPEAPAAAPPVPEQQRFDPAEDARLHDTWKKTGDRKALGALLTRYQPLISRQASRYYGADLPPAAIDAEAKEVAIKAFQNYDPSQGVRLSTYVTSYMPKIRQFVMKHQNPVRMSERVTLRMRSYQDATSELSDKLQRQPTAQEVADHRKWSMRDVKKLRILAGGAKISELEGETPMKDDGQRRSAIFLDYLYHELDGNQKKVLEHMYGMYGAKTAATDEEISGLSGIDPARVTRIRSQIADKIRANIEQV